MQVTVKLINFGSTEYQMEVALRRRVLRQPLGLEFSEKDLASDAENVHFGASVHDSAHGNEGARLIGCLFLTKADQQTVKMRQVAVAPENQGQGIGKRLVAFAEEWARENGFVNISLKARESAIPFYLALGYEPSGPVFQEVTLPHRQMSKLLTITP